MAKDTIIKERESKTDIAYRLMTKKKKEKNFYELWEEVKAEVIKNAEEGEDVSNLDEDISFFYTNLTLDGRFVNVGENKWNLRERVTFDKVHIDMNDIYSDDEETEETEDVEAEEEDIIVDEEDEAYDDPTGTDADIGRIRETTLTEDEE